MKHAKEEGGPGMIYIQAGMYVWWAQVRELKDDLGQAVSGAGEVSLKLFANASSWATRSIASARSKSTGVKSGWTICSA
jgi:hypothetical protein